MGSDGGSVIINQAASNFFPKVKPFCSVILSEAKEQLPVTFILSEVKEQPPGTVILSEAKDLAFCIYVWLQHSAMFNSQQSRSFASLRKTIGERLCGQ